MAAKKTSNKVYYYGTGRRKDAVAAVRLVPGKGNITINGKSIDDYFGLDTLKLIVRQPLAATQTEDKFDVIVKAIGGGISGQAGKAVLKESGFLTRDARMKERKKPGLKKARKASQFSKR